ncbi:hypothetical protein ASE15_03420 [Oerskovia sp. Root22]|nr:hypothetical protein ASE15_03420 [Oerskovia sp. Root22]
MGRKLGRDKGSGKIKQRDLWVALASVVATLLLTAGYDQWRTHTDRPVLTLVPITASPLILGEDGPYGVMGYMIRNSGRTSAQVSSVSLEAAPDPDQSRSCWEGDGVVPAQGILSLVITTPGYESGGSLSYLDLAINGTVIRLETTPATTAADEMDYQQRRAEFNELASQCDPYQF